MASPVQKEFLKKEVLRWREKKIINPRQVREIFSEYGMIPPVEKKDPVNVIKVLLTIGAIILGLGVILFVASHWTDIPTHIKTVMLIVGTCLTFLVGYYFHYGKPHTKLLGQALMLASCLFQGGTIMLIGQIYNVNAGAPSLLFLWAISVLAVGWLFDLIPALALSSLLFILWDGFFNAKLSIPNYI